MKLHNTLDRKLDDFKPLNGDQVKLYCCGLTVYSQPHIGNWVAYIYWDTLVRTLKLNGYQVNHVQNVTDVGHLTSDEDAGEDKMIKSALTEGKTAWQVAEKYMAIANHEAYDQLKLLKPTAMPRATDYIPQQIEFVKQLEQKGLTYNLADGVYFDTSKLKNYSQLAQLDIDGLRFGARVKDTGKKNPTDFALWKFSDPNQKRDMEWDSPWGKGFPGWHLECSVLAREFLGDQIDIHTGGIDHIPVHHTNEIAQTESLTGKPFAQIWLHANHMKVNGKKMSKSLGNIYTLKDITDKGFDLMAFKLLVLGKHYRTEGNFNWEIMGSAQNRFKRWQSIAELRWQNHATIEADHSKNTSALSSEIYSTIKQAKQALNTDLNTPEVLSTLEAVFNKLETTKPDQIQHSALMDLLDFIDENLGLNLLDSTADITDDQKRLILERQRAREADDWDKADQIRAELLKQKISLKDFNGVSAWQRT